MTRFLVVDNYDSFTYNLLHYLSDIAPQCEVWRNDVFDIEELEQLNPEAVLISPGPGRPQESGRTLDVVEWCVKKEKPLLGICLGHQAIGEYFGARLVHAQHVVHGKTSTIQHDGSGVFENLPSPLEVGRYHSLVLASDSFPDELIVTAFTDDGTEVMGLRHVSLPVEGVQFHPESILTPQGKIMLERFFQSI